MKSKINFDQYTDAALNELLTPQDFLKLQGGLPHLQTCKNVMDLVKRNIDYFNTVSGGGSGETQYCLEVTGGADNPKQTHEPFPPGTAEPNTCYLCGLPILNKNQAVATTAAITDEEQQLYDTSKSILEGYSDRGEITLQTFGLLENPINVWAFNSVVAELKVSNDRLAAARRILFRVSSDDDIRHIFKKINESYQTHPMYPEGEHVIDYKRAGYMNILSTRDRKYDENDPLSVAWRHQYAWAHRCCNQFKSQGDFCGWINGKGFYPPENINAFYTEMAKSDSKYAHVKYFHGPNGPLRRNFLGHVIPSDVSPYPSPSLEHHLSVVKGNVISRVNTILYNVNLNPVARIENIFSSECLNNLFVNVVLAGGKERGNEILTTLNSAEDIKKEESDLKSSIDNLLNDWTAIGAGGLLLEIGDGEVATSQDVEDMIYTLDDFDSNKRKFDDGLASIGNKSQRGDDVGQTPKRNPSALWSDVNQNLGIDPVGNLVFNPRRQRELVAKFEAVPVAQQRERRAAAEAAAVKIKQNAVEEAKKLASWEKKEEKLEGNIKEVINKINTLPQRAIGCDAIVEQFVDIAKNWSNIYSARSGFPARISDLHSKFKFILMSDGSIYVEQR
jgi:hypothetical protein